MTIDEKAEINREIDQILLVLRPLTLHEEPIIWQAACDAESSVMRIYSIIRKME